MNVKQIEMSEMEIKHNAQTMLATSTYSSDVRFTLENFELHTHSD